MSMTQMTGIGPEVKMAIGLVPAARSAGTANGTGVDRTGFHSMVLEAVTGAATGSPSAQTLDVKLQHSADNSSWSDFQPEGTAASGAVAQIAADSTRKRKSINLTGAKQYVRAVGVTAFTGGTSPTLPSAVVMVLGGAVEQPAQSDD